MNAQEYCTFVKQKHRRQKRLIPTMAIKENHSPLVSLKDSGLNLIFEPCIMRDYKYLVREEIFGKISNISKLLDKENKALIIRSAWRSFKHQTLLWDYYSELIGKENPNKRPETIQHIVSLFIASKTKSMHSTGGAVDALIYDLEDHCIMDFGTNNGYKIEHTKQCFPYHPDITPTAKRNRKLLIGLFENEDFVCDLKEYWHFDYGNVIWAIEKKKNYSIYGIVGATSL